MGPEDNLSHLCRECGRIDLCVGTAQVSTASMHYDYDSHAISRRGHFTSLLPSLQLLRALLSPLLRYSEPLWWEADINVCSGRVLSILLLDFAWLSISPLTIAHHTKNPL